MHIQRAASDAFLRYRDHGDVAALAEVFDMVAQELLLVASHLSNQRHDAEELLQETFVQAIHNAHHYDGVRPLEPWLVGILGNVARNARRRDQRRPDLREELEAEAATSPPAEIAAAKEFTSALHGVLQRLPLQHREVLTLHLVHGMTPTEIAHATARPVGTVKSWLFRGIRQLRTMLPAGFALAIAAFARAGQMVPNRALPQLREELLAQATALLERARSGVPTTAVRSSLWRPPILGAIAAAAVVLAAVAVWTLRGDHGAARPVQVAVADRPTSASAAATPMPAAEPFERASGAALAAGMLVIETGAGGIGGYVEPVLASDPRLRRRLFRSDDRGRAVIVDLPAGSWRCVADRGATATVELGDVGARVQLPIAGGLRATGIVVDGAGAPLAGSELWLSACDDVNDGSIVGATDRDGRFAIDDLPYGRWLSVVHTAYRPAVLQPLPNAPPSRAADAPAAAFRFVLDQPAAAVEFTVLDALGAPVPGATLQLGTSLLPKDLVVDGAIECRARPVWIGNSDAAGSVRCASTPVGERVLVCARAPDHPAALTTLLVTDPGTPVTTTLTLPPAARCHGRIERPADAAGNAAGDGDIVVRTRVARAVRDELLPRWVDASARAAADGSYELSGITAGPMLIRAALEVAGPPARSAQPWFAETTLELPPRGQGHWSARLGTGGVVRGTARTTAGAPLVGYVVTAEPRLGRALHTQVAADGTFALAELADVGYALWLSEATADDRVLAQRHDVRSGASVDLIVADAPMAFVHGRVATQPRRSGLTFDLTDAATGYGYDGPCDADGRFRVGPLPAGRYHWFAGTDIYWRAGMVEVGASDLDLGEVELVSAPSVRLWRAAGEVAPTGAVERAFLWTTDGLALASLCQLGADGVGTLLAPHGSYRLNVVRDGVLLSQQAIDLSPETESVQLLAPPAGQRLRLVATPPGPRAVLHLLWRIEGPGVDWFTQTNAQAMRRAQASALTVQLPPGNYTCRCAAEGGLAGELRFTVDAHAPVDAAAPPLVRSIELR